MTLRKKRYRRAIMHPVQNSPKPRYVYVSADTLDEIDQIRSSYAVQRKQIERGVLDPAVVEAKLTEQQRSREPVPLSALAARYLERENLSLSTKRNVFRFLTNAGRPLSRLDYRELTAPRLKEWVERLIARDLSLGYVQLQWWILRSIIAHCVERGIIAQSPWSTWAPKFRGARRAKSGEAARSIDELSLLLHAAHAIDEERIYGPGKVGQRTMRMLLEARIGCAALLGLHQGELAGLRWFDLDAEAGTVAIVRQYDDQPLKTTARTARMRALPELFEMLYLHALFLDRLELFDPQGPIFPSLARSIPGTPRPHRPGGSVIEPMGLREAVKRAGLPNPHEWTATSLRRTFATLELEGAAGDLVAASERTRHATVANFLKYLRRRTRGPAAPGFSLRRAPVVAPPELVGEVVAPAPALVEGSRK
jgi:integrase